MLKHFSPQKDTKIDWAKADMGALQMLDNARDIADIPFDISSNYRTPEHSVEVGGIKNDAHTETPCTAFDIACYDSASRLKIVKAVLQAGFTRVGIKINHIHVDCSPKLPQNVLWLE